MCTNAFVIHREFAGDPAAFSTANQRGKLPSLAAAYGISAHSIVQERNAPPTLTTRPRLISAAPSLPTRLSSTPAIEGTARPVSSFWLKIPVDSSDTRT